MARSIVPTWLILSTLTYAEGEDNGGDGGNNGDTGGDNSGGGKAEGEGLSPDELAKGNIDNLLKALQTERDLRKKAESANKKRDQEEADKALREQGEVALLTKKLEEEQTKRTELARRYLADKLDAEIREEARALNFIDVTDALGGVKRSDIVVEQSDDNPADVVIEPNSLKKAVKALADAKKHLIKTSTDDGQPTGSSFGGSGKDKDKTSTKDRIKELYPNI